MSVNVVPFVRRLVPLVLAGCASTQLASPPTPSPDALVERAVVEAMSALRHPAPNVRVDVRVMDRDRWDALAEGRAFVDVPWADAWRHRAMASGWPSGNFPRAYDCNEVFFLGYTMRIHRKDEPPPPIAPEKLERMESCRVPEAEFTLVATPPLALPDGEEVGVAVYGIGHARAFSAEARFDEAGRFLRIIVVLDYIQ